MGKVKQSLIAYNLKIELKTSCVNDAFVTIGKKRTKTPQRVKIGCCCVNFFAKFFNHKIFRKLDLNKATLFVN